MPENGLDACSGAKDERFPSLTLTRGESGMRRRAHATADPKISVSVDETGPHRLERTHSPDVSSANRGGLVGDASRLDNTRIAWAARTGPPMQHSSSTNARHAWQVGSGVGVPWVGDPVPP
jgi:hypothetical protein